jgi:glutamyl-tRNA reductase
VKGCGLDQLICVGLSYKTAPVDIRERFALSAQQQTSILNRSASDVAELAILSTCNRTELYAVGDADSVRYLHHTLAASGTLSGNDLQAFTYTLKDEDCVRHLLRVAAGLDSQVIGEPQILGQITRAYQRASQAGSAGPVLSALMQSAIHTGKRVRHETELAQGALSISAVAARHAGRIAGSLNRANVLIVGAGEMAQSAAGSLLRRGVGRLVVVSRTHEHAEAMAAELGATAVPYDMITEALIEADIVITAAGSPEALFDVDDIAALMPRRLERPLLILDIALPRNVAPAVKALSGVQLYNLDDLQAEADVHRAERESAVPRAEAIVGEEITAFGEWLASRTVVPVIQQLRAKAEDVRQAELEHLSRRLPDLAEQDRQVLDELLDGFSQRLVNKLLHGPTLRLKVESSEGRGQLYASVLSDLFDLESNER